MPLPGPRDLEEPVQGHLHGRREVGHVPHDHLLGGGDRRLLVAGLLEGEGPTGAAGAPVVVDDAHVIEPAQGVDGGDGDLLPPVVALGHLGGVHDQGQGAADDLAGLWGIELDGKYFGDLRVDPAAGPEGLGSPEHDQPSAQVVHVGVQGPVLLVGQGVAGDVGQHHGVVAAHEHRPAGEGGGRQDIDRDAFGRQCGDEEPRLLSRLVHDEDLALAAHEGDAHRRVVAADTVIERVVGLEDRLELHGPGRVERDAHRHDRRARRQGEPHGHALLGPVEVEELVVHLEGEPAARLALAAQDQPQLRGGAQTGPRRRDEPLEDHLPGVLVVEDQDIDGHAVGPGEICRGKDGVLGLVAVGDQEEPVGGVVGSDGQGGAHAGGQVRRVELGRLGHVVADGRVLVGHGDDRGVLGDGDQRETVLGMLALHGCLLQIAKRGALQRQRHRLAAVEDHGDGEPLPPLLPDGAGQGSGEQQDHDRPHGEGHVRLAPREPADRSSREPEHRHEQNQ